MQSIASRAYSNFGSVLNGLGYNERFGAAVDQTRLNDPWHSLRQAQYEEDLPPESALTIASALCLRNESLPLARVNSAFGPQLVLDLYRSGMLAIENGICSSRYCLLVVGGYLLLVDWPVQTLHGLVSRHVYLGKSSCECARRILTTPPTGATLEIGCGTGLLCMLASDTADSVTGSDIWGLALHLARCNMALNQKHIEVIFSDLFKRIPIKHYDTIFCNPPWRLAPPTLHYPNPQSRVGRGMDGLDFVRGLLKQSVDYLAPNGSLWFPVEFPGDHKGFPFRIELEDFVNSTRCTLTIAQRAPVPVELQASESAQTCAPWNRHRSLEWLKEQFVKQYWELRCDTLYPAICTVVNNGLAKLIDTNHVSCDKR